VAEGFRAPILLSIHHPWREAFDMNRILASLAALVLICSGCVPLQQYRSKQEICHVTGDDLPPDAQCQIEQTEHYKLGFVELDDQGWLLKDREQLKFVLENLKQEEASSRQIIVAFVHGWKHNASSGDGNVKMVRNNLELLSRLEIHASKSEHRPARRLFGVYLGWRGLSSSVNYVNNLTFWERKNTAHEVGRGALAEVFVRLDKIRRESQEHSPEGEKKTRLIIVGHSFGGAATYSALAPLLMEQVIFPETAGTRIGIGDLTVLVNPAFEASKFAVLRDAALAETFLTNQPVRLAVFTSRKDSATKIFFPIGRSISTVFEHYFSKFEKRADRTAIGHFSRFQSHDLKLSEEGKKTEEEAVRSATAKQVLQGKAPPKLLSFGECDLIPRGNVRRGFPIYNIYVDPRIIKDHNDIDNPKFLKFLTAFFVHVLD
jgi:hypothetical protein